LAVYVTECIKESVLFPVNISYIEGAI